MEFRDVLSRRRMTRTYRPDPVPREALERVAATIRRVPSAGFSQGQRLVVVTHAEQRRAVAAACHEDAYEQPWISAAPAQIVVGVAEEAYHRRYGEADKLDDEGREIEWPVPYWFVDGGALMMLVLLAAIDEGLASGFVGAPDAEALRVAVGFPEGVRPIGVATLGYPADADPIRTSRSAARRRPLDELVRWERWDEEG
jgi:FMN reductase [NAD(P)H]